MASSLQDCRISLSYRVTITLVLLPFKKKNSLHQSDRRGSALTDSCNTSVDRQEEASWQDAVESGKARLAPPRRAGPAHPSGLPYAPHIAMLL